MHRHLRRVYRHVSECQATNEQGAVELGFGTQSCRIVAMRKDERPAKHAGLEAFRHTPGVCACQKLRGASRVVTRMYDDCLRPTGITIGQYSVLAALYFVPSIPLRKLAQRLEMDRTTLTRSLSRLDRDGLVTITLDPKDTRVRSISITEADRGIPILEEGAGRSGGGARIARSERIAEVSRQCHRSAKGPSIELNGPE